MFSVDPSENIRKSKDVFRGIKRDLKDPSLLNNEELA